MDIGKIPIFYGLFLAIIVTEFSIPVPVVFGKSLSLMGQATIPLMIFILGLQLSAIKFNRSPDLLAVIIVATTLFSGISLTFLIKMMVC